MKTILKMDTILARLPYQVTGMFSPAASSAEIALTSKFSAEMPSPAASAEMPLPLSSAEVSSPASPAEILSLASCAEMPSPAGFLQKYLC